MRALPILALALLASACTAAYLPTPTPPDPNAGQYARALQITLDRGDYAKLTAMMQAKVSSTQKREEMQWARKQSDDGATLLLPVLYAQSSWRIGSNLDATSPELNYRDIAARYVLYSLAVAAVDGLRCKDPAVAAAHAQQIEQEANDILDYAADRPPYSRGRLVNAAIDLEIRTAPKRQDDPWLCRAKLEDPPPAAYESQESWQGKIADTRSEVRTRLNKLLDERAAKAGRS